MKSLLKITALLAALALPLTGCTGNSGNSGNTGSTGESPEKITFVLDWTPNTNHTGLFVAQELGYYTEAGLEVELIQPPEGDAPTLVASGKAQFGIGAQDTLAPAFARENPLPVTAIAALVQHNTSGILSLEQAGIASPKDMMGKVYATWENPVEQAMLKTVVEKDGGDFGQVKLIPSTPTDILTALRTDFDAIWVFYAWDGIAAQVKGLNANYFAFSDIDPVFDYYTPIILSSNNYLAQKPDTVRAFLAATQKGYAYAMENPEEAAAILLKHAPELDAQLVQQSQAWLSAKYQDDAPRWGAFDPARWDGFYTWLSENNLLEKPLPAGTGYTNEFLPQ